MLGQWCGSSNRAADGQEVSSARAMSESLCFPIAFRISKADCTRADGATRYAFLTLEPVQNLSGIK
jgi:hypothetical protein